MRSARGSARGALDATPSVESHVFGRLRGSFSPPAASPAGGVGVADARRSAFQGALYASGFLLCMGEVTRELLPCPFALRPALALRSHLGCLVGLQQMLWAYRARSGERAGASGIHRQAFKKGMDVCGGSRLVRAHSAVVHLVRQHHGLCRVLIRERRPRGLPSAKRSLSHPGTVPGLR